MKKIGMFFILTVVASQAVAVDLNLSDLDKEIRSSGSKSIMFQHSGATSKEQDNATKKEQPKAEPQKKATVFQQYNLFGSGYKIAALVNGEMVSNKDLQERANLLSLTTGIQVNARNKKMISERVMQNVIDEKIKLQEAQKQNVHVSDEEIQEAYRNFERSNGIPRGKFQRVLNEYHVSKEVFLTQIRANLLWNKLVARRLGSNVDVSVREVEEEFDRIKKDMETPKYMVSEIVIKRKDGDHIEELVDILRKDPRFELYAAQFSQSASAPSGGKLGWISPGQLAKPLDNVVRNLGVGKVSNAVLYRNEYYIFKMDKIYNPKQNKKDMPKEEEVRAFIKNRKTDAQANKYIRDLRNRAVVERKF